MRSWGIFKRLAILLVILSLVLSPCGAYAEEVPDAEESAPIELCPANKDDFPEDLLPTEAYTPVKVYFDGLLTCIAYLEKEELWLPVQDLCTWFGSETTATWYPAEETLLIIGNGVDLSMVFNSEYIELNRRYLYMPVNPQCIEGKLCFPSSVTDRMFQLSTTLSSQVRADVVSTAGDIISGSDTYYEDTFGEENMYWLSHLINAEAGHSSIKGRIGVGNVVFNRMASPKYPSTLYEVIFDTNSGVQFAPTVNGKIGQEPNELSWIAACLCFEGYNTVNNAIFFDEAWADLSWLDESRFVCRIGNHLFYS